MKKLLTLKEFKEQGFLEEGCYFKLSLDPKDLTEEEFLQEQSLRNGDEEVQLFRYTKEINSDNGKIHLLGEPTKDTVGLEGMYGYNNAISIISEFCKDRFSIPSEMEARNINIDEQEKLPSNLQYGEYWISKTYFKEYNGIRAFGVVYFDNGYLYKSLLSIDDDDMPIRVRAVRPIISIYGQNVRIIVGKFNNGKKADTAYEIVIIRAINKKKEDGNCIKGETLTIEEFSKRGLLKEGCWFKFYLDTSVSSELKKDVTGYTKVQDIKNELGAKCFFRYTKVLNDSKELRLLGEPINCMLYLSGKKGYENGPLVIELFCKTKFSYGTEIEARSITWDEQEELPIDLQYGEYWLPEKYRRCNMLAMQCIRGTELTYVCLYRESNKEKQSKIGTGCEFNSVRPIIKLCSQRIKILIGEKYDGRDQKTAYEIVIE